MFGLSTAGWFVLRSVHQSELARLTEDLEIRTNLTAAALQPLLVSPRPSNPFPPTQDQALQLQVKTLSREAGARITVIGLDGTIRADSATPSGLASGLGNLGTRPEIRQSLTIGRGTDIRTSQATGLPMLYLAIPIRNSKGRPLGAVRLALPLTALDLRIQDLKRAMGIAFMVALALAMILSTVIARGLSRPISEIAAAARTRAAGTLGQRLDTASGDEVRVLGTTLNQMAEQLEMKIREISEDRAQLLAMLTAMVEGVMILDGRGKVLQVNPALERMFGFRAKEAKGRLHWEVIRHHELNELAARALTAQCNLGGEVAMTPGGRCFRVEASVYSRQRENEPSAVLVFHDITALRRLEKVRKDFVANVSHEIKTPLTAIKGYVEALLDGAKDSPAQAQKFLQIILAQTDRLNRILEDLLHLSQMESGELRFKREPISLGHVVDRTLLLMRPLADKKGHTLTLDLPDSLPLIFGDEDQLVQVFTNLLDNAIKYTPERGTIHIASRFLPEPSTRESLPARGHEDGTMAMERPAKESGFGVVECTVTDTGLGIPEPERPRVFERFYRVDKARSRELGGTGLGLAIVKHIVEGHGGRVWVEGNTPMGSRFILQLPVETEETEGNGEPPALPPQQSSPPGQSPAKGT